MAVCFLSRSPGRGPGPLVTGSHVTTHRNVCTCRKCDSHSLSYAQGHIKPLGCLIHATHETLPLQVKDKGQMHSLALMLFPGRQEKMPKL